ncbi:MAG TPA: outer membrane protein assembly factor BamD [Alphaproteobacteria bacterium]|nr:outer membrane protein assembly factor BamD [Alphaproteobacteria bacterium]
MVRAAFLAVLTLALAACGSRDKDEYIERPPEQLYNQGIDALLDERYVEAAKQFDEVERQHPYSVWATKGQLMAAYAHYQNNKYDDAIVALDRFIQLNPSNRDVAYAYYLKALCYYEQITDVQRDARMTELALKSLDEVVRRFPESAYGRDARLKIELTYDHLAGKEMEVGRFYQRRGHYLAAINRFKVVAEKWQTTNHVPEALHRLIECYLALGLTEEARKTAAVLGHNYPGSEWYVDSYALVVNGALPAQERPGFFARAFSSIF